MLEFFQYEFIIRGLEAGILVAILAPLIGIFLVLRRYSLIADTLSHVSLAGVAIGLLAKINPIITALLATIISAVWIERLRLSKKVYGETALALFLSGGLALAVVIISLAHGFNVNLFSYLFGSIVTVKSTDVTIIATLSAVVIIILFAFYKELVYISFDEESAQVSGIPTRAINIIFILLASVVIALAIPIVGVLLVSALVVIPVITALQLKKSFKQTILWAELFSVVSVIAGIISSFYFDISPGGTIVLITIAIFSIVALWKKIG